MESHTFLLIIEPLKFYSCHCRISFSSQTDCNEQYRRCFPSQCDISVKNNSTDEYKYTTSSDVYLKYCTTEERTKVKFHSIRDQIFLQENIDDRNKYASIARA